MSLDLDTRQRAMLLEMGITVWSPVSNAIKIIADEAINTPATAKNESKNALLASQTPQNVEVAASSAPAAASRPVVNVAKPVLAQPAMVAAPLPVGLDRMDWASLQQAAATCQACQLGSGRKNSVFGSLSAAQQADWLIVGDPPVESDEIEGAPFTGEAGQLLANMLKAMGLSVQQVVLTSATKCRTEGLSTGPHELAQCEAYLRRQVALTRPKMILAMGRYAAQALLAQTVGSPVPPLGQLRGVVHRYQGLPVVVTYAPANLLRSPADKAKAWADLCLAQATLQTSV